MTRRSFRSIVLLLILPLCMSAFACRPFRGGSDELRYWTLQHAPKTERKAAAERVISLGPIRLPDYLDRQEVVTRIGPNQLDIARFDHWSDPLEHNILRAMATQLEAAAPGIRVVPHLWNQELQISHSLLIGFTSFEAHQTEGAQLEAGWAIVDAKQTVLVEGAWKGTVPLDGEGYVAYVAAMSAVLAEFCKVLANELERAPELEMSEPPRAVVPNPEPEVREPPPR